MHVRGFESSIFLVFCFFKAWQKYINHLKQYALTMLFCTFAAGKIVLSLKNVFAEVKDCTFKIN
ncbi:hypothetical protein DW712_08090 [Bacteroides intestinalis]|uniref:Uncharacterized protein n=1 Tax=Bacteroides intestinalis TaxID=329854 RepID=A0A412YLX7_9BACE|nr:hypothetical protein DWW10_01900 [Bacteroides intestinalis]RHA63495.1 hypothetical protein DW932_01970 [Bacteroides intestinalis]RHE93070.1 hypothetical protein DW712_08090 [Bacteroides intestinalis]